MSSACELSRPSVITALASFSKASLSSEAASFRLCTRRQCRYGFMASTKSSHKTSAWFSSECLTATAKLRRCSPLVCGSGSASGVTDTRSSSLSRDAALSRFDCTSNAIRFMHAASLKMHSRKLSLRAAHAAEVCETARPYTIPKTESSADTSSLSSPSKKRLRPAHASPSRVGSGSASGSASGSGSGSAPDEHGKRPLITSGRSCAGATRSRSART